MSNFKEAKEEFGKMLRWNEQPKDAKQAEKTIFMGTVVQGFYTGRREKVGANDSSVYEMTLANGEKVAFWGSDLLDGKFKEIPMDCEVRVTCLGTQQPKTPKGRAYLGFKVEFDASSRKPANLVAAGEAAPTGVAAAPVAAPVAAPAPAPVAAAPVATPGQGEGF